MLMTRLLVSIFTVGLMVLGAGSVSGQDYPNKTVRIVTAAAGGGSDFTARLIAQGISGPFGQPVVVDNRSGVVMGEYVAKSPPDGYTLLVAGGSHWIRPLLAKMPYDPVKDFSPISQLTREVLIFVVHPSLPVKSVKEMIALAKARPGELNYSTSSLGGTTHLATELFMSMAAVNIVHVPYKGQAAAITALISGEVQMTITDAGLLTPHMKSGKIRALAVTSATPSALAPGLPTVTASGLPRYETVGMSVIFAPAKTPAAIINRLNQEIVRLLGRTDVKERFLNAGAEAVGNSPEEFAAIIKSDMAKWSKVIKDAGIKVD